MQMQKAIASEHSYFMKLKCDKRKTILGHIQQVDRSLTLTNINISDLVKRTLYGRTK